MALIMSDQNFRRFFDLSQSDQPGADQTERGRGCLAGSRKLRRILPKDVVWTQEQIVPTIATTGLAPPQPASFWDGAVSCIVGVVIISDSLH